MRPPIAHRHDTTHEALDVVCFVLRQVAKDAVVVEADAIKNKDVVYQQLNRRLSRMGRSTSDLSKYVHEYSTKAAESMFVAAINQQRVRDPCTSHKP